MIDLTDSLERTLSNEQIQRINRVARFLEVVEADHHDVHGVDRYELYEEYAIDREWWDSPTEVTVSSENGESIEVRLSICGLTGYSPLTAPLEYWNVDQTVDDGNLLTLLELFHPDGIRGSVSVSGPAAASGIDRITLEHADESQYLL